MVAEIPYEIVGIERGRDSKEPLKHSIKKGPAINYISFYGNIESELRPVRVGHIGRAMALFCRQSLSVTDVSEAEFTLYDYCKQI